MLVEGRGLDADPAEGRVWLARAADAGVVDAQVMLGEMMVNGRGGSRDDDAALALFNKAARQGHAGAMFALGVLADGSREVANRAAAQDWFRQAAEQGHSYAALMLGRYLARGLAGITDLVEARRWLEAARAAGVTEAELDLVRWPARDAASAHAGATAA
jgi:TPR repeat protein